MPVLPTMPPARRHSLQLASRTLPVCARHPRATPRDPLLRSALLATVILFGGASQETMATSRFDDETAAMLVDAVEAAFELDFYNDRCRSDRSGRRTENLNKLITSKLRITVIGVQDDLFPEGSYRSARPRMEAAFLEQLRTLGGCEGAKAAGLRLELRERYDAALTAIGALP